MHVTAWMKKVGMQINFKPIYKFSILGGKFHSIGKTSLVSGTSLISVDYVMSTGRVVFLPCPELGLGNLSVMFVQRIKWL
jgi:hypothetical protein